MLWLGSALICSLLLFVPGLFEQFETPKIEAVRLCGLGALAWSLVSGLAGRPRRWRPLDVAVAAWLLVEFLATALSGSPRLSLLGETRQHEGLLTSLSLAGLYFVGREALSRVGRTRATLLLWIVAASLVGLYALIQVAGLDPLQWRREAVYAGGYVRPFATMGHPNLLGAVTAAVAPLALALALTQRRGSSAWLLAAAAGLLALVTIATLSRAAWLGIGAGVVVAAGLALRERGLVRLTPRAWALVTAAIVLVAVLVVLATRGGPLGRRFAELWSGGGVSGSSRIEIWRTALAAWRARPLTGQGPDLFELVFPHFQTAAYWRYEWSGLPVHAHSIYLHTLATRGVLGLLAGAAWAAVLLAAAARVWRERARVALPGLIPAALASLASLAVEGAFGALGIAGALLLVSITAVVATADESLEPAGDEAAVRSAPAGAPAAEPSKAAGRRRSKESRSERRAVARRPAVGPHRLAGRLAATVAALLAGGWGYTELRASRAASAAQEFMTSSPPRAVQASDAAIHLAPHDDRLWRMRAETLLWLTTVVPDPGAALAAAEEAARRAVALAPGRAENHRILARALAASAAPGDGAARSAAEAEYRRSMALAPMDGLILMDYADWMSMAGRPGPAREAARRGVALYPDAGELQAVLARALLAAGERDSARVALERALRASWYLPAERREAERQLEGLRRALPTGPAR
jgi:O-antigen ligase